MNNMKYLFITDYLNYQLPTEGEGDKFVCKYCNISFKDIFEKIAYEDRCMLKPPLTEFDKRHWFHNCCHCGLNSTRPSYNHDCLKKI